MPGHFVPFSSLSAATFAHGSLHTTSAPFRAQHVPCIIVVTKKEHPSAYWQSSQVSFLPTSQSIVVAGHQGKLCTSLTMHHLLPNRRSEETISLDDWAANKSCVQDSSRQSIACHLTEMTSAKHFLLIHTAEHDQLDASIHSRPSFLIIEF